MFLLRIQTFIRITLSSSLVDIVLMIILTMTILPTIIIILFIIIPMMLVILPAAIGTQEEQDVFPDDMTMNYGRPPPVLITIALATSSSSTSSYKESGKRNEV